MINRFGSLVCLWRILLFLRLFLMSLDSARATDLSGRAGKNFLFPWSAASFPVLHSFLLIGTGTINGTWICVCTSCFGSWSGTLSILTSFSRRKMDKHLLLVNSYLTLKKYFSSNPIAHVDSINQKNDVFYTVFIGLGNKIETTYLHSLFIIQYTRVSLFRKLFYELC